MPSNPEPTQPLTEEDLAHVRRRLADPLAQPSAWEARLLAEVDRLRATTCSRRDLEVAEEITRAAELARHKAEVELSRLRAENTAMAAALERPPASPDEEFDAVREHALKVGDKRVTELLQAFDWLRTELAYSERIKDYVRKQHTDLEGAFDLVIKQCGKLRAERDSLAAALDQSGEER